MLRPARKINVPVLLTLVLAAATLASRTASAQDFRVATTVSQRAANAREWTPVGHSVTLFHAGKVYDHMENVGEVVIFEPAQSRFVILSFNGNHLATTIRFEELQQFLKVAKTKMESRVQQLSPNALEPAVRDRRDALQFQLEPRFEETYDPSTKTLTLISPLVRYEVETDISNKPLVVQEYLQYADWAARINFVLHSGALYPEVRLAVNRSLAERDRIPTEVRLLLDGQQPLHLKAEHKFDWSLSTIDHSVIRRCEQARTDDDTRWLNFREYQRTLVAATSR